MTYSSIRDNHVHGTVGDFLKEHLKDHSNVSIVSAYFTIFAYQHLKENLENIDELRFLFGDPTFIKSIDPDKTNFRELKIEDDNLVIATEKIIGQKVDMTATGEDNILNTDQLHELVENDLNYRNQQLKNSKTKCWTLKTWTKAYR